MNAPIISRGEFDGMRVKDIHAALVAEADARHAPWPQYNGRFSGSAWAVAVIARDVRTKAGLAFAKHDVVLVDTTPEGFSGTPARNFRIALSRRTGWMTSIPLNAFVLMEVK